MSEAELREQVLIPLFRAMGFRDVYHYHGGALEVGKDIVMWKPDDFGQRTNYAAVVKAKRISGKTTGSSSAGEILTQVQQVFGEPFKDPVTGSDETVHRCFVACSKSIGKETFNALQGALQGLHLDRMTTFLHGDILWAAVEKHSPERTVVSKLDDARRILGQVSSHYRVTAEVGENLAFKIGKKHGGSIGEEDPSEFSGRFEFPDTDEGREAVQGVPSASVHSWVGGLGGAG